MGKKLPDTIVACNIIKYQRQKNRTLKHKNIRVDFDNDEKLYTRLVLVFNPVTGTVSWAHCLRYKRLAFYPTTNQRLRCTNQHALNMLDHAREYQREYRRERVRIRRKKLL